VQLAVWNVLLLYSHYLGGFIILIEIILLILFFKRISFSKGVFLFLSFAISFVLYLPGISLFLKRLGTFSDKGTWVPDVQLSEIYGNIIRFFNNTFTFFVIVGAVTVFIIVFRKKLKERFKSELLAPKSLFIFLFFGLTYLGMFIFSKLVQPVFLDRYLLFTSILLFISVLIIISSIVKTEKQWLSLIIIIPMAISTKWIPNNNRNPENEVLFIKNNIKQNDIIAICPPFYDLTFMYHYDKKLFADYKHFEANKFNAGIHSIYSYEDLKLKNASLSSSVFFLDANSEFTYPGNNIKIQLDSNFNFNKSEEFDGGIKIYKFDSK